MLVSFLSAYSFLEFGRVCLKHNDFSNSMNIMSLLATTYDIIVPCKVGFFGAVCVVLWCPLVPTHTCCCVSSEGWKDRFCLILPPTLKLLVHNLC